MTLIVVGSQGPAAARGSQGLGHLQQEVDIQGGAVNRGLKCFFLLYRPSCLIEAYDRPEKYWLVWAGPLASHLFNFNFIFLSDGLTAAAARAAYFVYIYHR